MTQLTNKPRICLWFEHSAREAATFYASTFPDSFVGTALRAPTDYPDGKQGDELVVARASERAKGGERATQRAGSV